MSPTSRTHVLVGAILAGLQVLNGAVLIDTFGPAIGGLAVAVIGACQAGWQVYTAGVSVPAGAVAAVVDPKSGTVVAGPAAPQPNGTEVQLAG